MKTFHCTPAALALLGAFFLTPFAQAQPEGPQMAPEVAQKVWALEAQHVAGKLGLSGKQTLRLAAAFEEARESFTKSLTARIEEQTADLAPDDWRRERAYRRALTEVGKAEREKFLEVLNGFLPAAPAKKAVEGLGTFHILWDPMVKAMADLGLGREQAGALEAINTFVVDSTALAGAPRDPGDTMGGFRAEGKVMKALTDSLETILSGAQMAKWVNAVGRTHEDDDRSIEDPRVRHRTYRFEEAGGIEIPYALFVPSTYNGEEKYPLMVGLHGLGRTYDWLMGYEGILDFAERDGYIMVMPLGYVRGGWYGSVDSGRIGELSEKDVMNVFEIVRKEFNVDENRIYLWGHSMGGAGAYRLAEKHPEIWAGLGVAAPAPSVSPDLLETFKHIPIIVLQGDRDGLVTITRRWVAKMKELGMEHVYIEDPGGDHSFFISKNPENQSKIFAFFNIVAKKGSKDE